MIQMHAGATLTFTVLQHRILKQAKQAFSVGPWQRNLLLKSKRLMLKSL